jgi:uncharacterized membrane protein
VPRRLSDLLWVVFCPREQQCTDTKRTHETTRWLEQAFAERLPRGEIKADEYRERLGQLQ